MPPPSTTLDRPIQVFGITWGGQLISIIGSELTAFSLGMEVYTRTSSIIYLAVITILFQAPVTLLSPIAGALVDRWDRRWAMLVSDLGAGLSSLSIWLMLITSHAGVWSLKPWHFFIPVAVSSAFGALRWPAYYATTTLLVPKQHLTRANAMVEMAQGAARIIGPGTAGLLVARIGLQGVVMIDLSTFVFAVGTLLLVRFPSPPRSEASQAAEGALIAEMVQGWRFLRGRCL